MVNTSVALNRSRSVLPSGASRPLRGVGRVLMLVLLLGVTACCEGAFEIRSVKRAGKTYLLFADVAAYYGMQFHHDGDDVKLTSRYSDLRFTIDRRDATLNGVRVYLSRAVDSWRQRPLVSEADFRLLIDPILRHQAMSKRPVKRIVIDPGHGGDDQGSAGKTQKEKQLNLLVARRLYILLRQRGYTVYMTRNSDRTLPLETRVKQVRYARADLFVSIHSNAVATASVRGIETFLLTPEGTPSTYGTEDKSAADVGNTFDRENSRLAYEVQKELIRYTRAEDRGIKHANFVVLRDPPCPAVLVEMGFISHAAEEQKLASSRYQQCIAQGIADGIVAFDQAMKRIK